MSILAKKLEDKVKQRRSGFLLVSKALELISKATDSPIDDVKKYLLFSDMDIEIPVYHYKGGSRFEVLETSRPDGYFTGTRKALKEPLEGNEYFLVDDLNKFEPLLEYDIFAYERGYHYVATQSVGRFTAGEKIIGVTENRARELLREGVIEKLAVNEKRSTAVMNNSLASYVSEYTLPQVVALILHIDLADITTNPSNSYINDQNKYGEGVYQKFENLLQSYSVAALNEKLDGVDLHTRTSTTYSGDETRIDLEQTSISRSKLASYLASIGYNLDDLIAKQEPIHNQNNDYQQNDPELVSNLQQQVVELQTCIDEKDKDLKAKSEELDAALKKVKQAGATGSDNEPLNERSERSYLNTVGLMLELLTKPRNEGGTAPFPSEAAIISRIEERDIYGQKSSKLGERFKEAKDALADEKKKKTLKPLLPMRGR